VFHRRPFVFQHGYVDEMSDLESAARSFRAALLRLITEEADLRHRLFAAWRSGLDRVRVSDGTIPPDTADRIATLAGRFAGASEEATNGSTLEALSDEEVNGVAEYLLEVGFEVESEFRRAAGNGTI
jgi:hypothetical protein